MAWRRCLKNLAARQMSDLLDDKNLEDPSPPPHTHTHLLMETCAKFTLKTKVNGQQDYSG